MTIVYEVGNGLYVNLTNRCPCSCEFCIRKNGQGAYGSASLWLERGEPTVDETVAAIEAAGVERRDELVFCGYGEPTERLDELLVVASRVKAAHPGLLVRVNTNGLADLIAGRPTAARFGGRVDAVSVSLNAATAEEYVALCHPKFGLAAYPAVLAFTREIRAYVPSVVMTVVATPDFTAAKRAACEAVCAGIGVPLRVRNYLGK
ncbi:MAG: TatD family nuclease-associated radical SAM protein [Kiritimatiellia bacterium]